MKNSSEVNREKALRELLEEMRKGDVEIHSDKEAQAYLDFAAKQRGLSVKSVHAVAIGDDILARKEYAENVRILREEWIHIQQQRRGLASNRIVEAEIEAREMMIRNRRKWAITNEEVREMIREIRLMRERGRY
jgi:hypothetical protein